MEINNKEKDYLKSLALEDHHTHCGTLTLLEENKVKCAKPFKLRRTQEIKNHLIFVGNLLNKLNQ